MRRNKFLVALFLVVILLLTLSACNQEELESGTKSVTIVIGNEKFETQTDVLYLHDLLIELSQKESFNYEYELSEYGSTIMKIKGLETAFNWDPFISIYHNIDDVTLRSDLGVYPVARYKYEGIEYYPSSAGASNLPIINGAVYLLEEVNL